MYEVADRSHCSSAERLRFLCTRLPRARRLLPWVSRFVVDLEGLLLLAPGDWWQWSTIKPAARASSAPGPPGGPGASSKPSSGASSEPSSPAQLRRRLEAVCVGAHLRCALGDVGDHLEIGSSAPAAVPGADASSRAWD